MINQCPKLESFVFSDRYPDNIVGNFILEKTIGEGTFGKVYLGTHIPTKEKVAVKVLEKDKIKEGDSLERVNREINLLKNLKNENVIQLFEKYEDKYIIFLFMEYAEDGELFNYIVNNTRIKEKEASYFFVQIIQGVEFIHQNFICHRDLKPENILINENKILKIIDFGLSNSYKNNVMLETPCGSPCYAAPEMLLGNKYSGLLIDIWSVGIILYAMIHGFLPFEDENNVLLYKKILECKLEFPFEISSSCKDMIKRLLSIIPEKRIKMSEIKVHPFYKMGINYSKKQDFVIDHNRISKKTIEKLVKIGYKLSEIKQTLKKNKSNYILTAYNILYNKVKSIAYRKNLISKESTNKGFSDNLKLPIYQNKLCETDDEIENNDLNDKYNISIFSDNDKNDNSIENKRETQSNGNKESQKSLKIINEMNKTQSKEELSHKNDFINHTYSKSTKSDELFKLDKDKKMNSIVQLYTKNDTRDSKEESNSSNKNISLFKNRKENLNFNSKNSFSYNTLFNKNLSSKQILQINQNASKDQKGLIKNDISKVVPLSTLTNNIYYTHKNGNLHNAVINTQMTYNPNVLNTFASNFNEDKIERDNSKKKINHNNNLYPLQVENGNKMFTKMKINPNIQVLLKDFKHNVKHMNIASIFKKKNNTSRTNLNDKNSEYCEDNRVSEIDEYKRNHTKEFKSVNRNFKQTSASPNSFIPLSTSNKLDKLSNFNYSNSYLSTNYNKREISKDTTRQETVSLRPTPMIPETTKSPIKLFSPTNKTLMLTTKNKYSNLSNKIESFFNKKELNIPKKSVSPSKNILDEPRIIHLDLRNDNKVIPVLNFKQNKPNTLKLYTKATSSNNETPTNLNDTNFINSTKNKNKDYLTNDATFLKDRAIILKEKIFKFCQNNNFDITEIYKNTIFECINNNHRFKIELNTKNTTSKPFKVTHIKGREETTKDFMTNLINNIDKDI